VSGHGGGNSFIGLTADRAGMEKLSFPSVVRSSCNGQFIISTGGTATSVVLSGTGAFIGTNDALIEITAQVFPDSVYLNFNN
jgi:hypothetical protein